MQGFGVTGCVERFHECYHGVTVGWGEGLVGGEVVGHFLLAVFVLLFSCLVGLLGGYWGCDVIGNGGGYLLGRSFLLRDEG